MDRDVYNAAYNFVKGLKELDPIYYGKVTITDVLPYFYQLARKLETIKNLDDQQTALLTLSADFDTHAQGTSLFSVSLVTKAVSDANILIC